jgi:hypothetical protein
MAVKKEETASFVLRLSQKIYNSDDGEPQVQWRGNVRHVQSGDEKRFGNYEAFTAFVQSKLSDLTLKAIEDKPEAEQKGILSNSFEFWKKMALNAPKLVLDSLKDPKGQATNLQVQIQDQFHQINQAIGQKFENNIGNKLEFENWPFATKSDNTEILKALLALTKKVEGLNKKVNDLNKKIK